MSAAQADQRVKRRKTPKRIFVNPKRFALLERIGALATELCISVDRAAEDIGGSRRPMTILRDIGPLTDELERLK